jgi:hypothetical protein
MNDANPSVETRRYHAVRFYENDRSLARIVAEFLGNGLVAGNPAIVIATPAQRAAIMRELIDRSIDVVEFQQNGNFAMFDAEEMLSTFMKNGKPNAGAFRYGMCELIRTVCRDRPNCTVQIYGQMVDLLWRAGQQEAAIRLEVLWNHLARTRAFSLLCGYAMGSFYKDAHLDEICSQHTHVISADGTSAVA